MKYCSLNARKWCSSIIQCCDYQALSYVEGSYVNVTIFGFDYQLHVTIVQCLATPKSHDKNSVLMYTSKLHMQYIQILYYNTRIAEARLLTVSTLLTVILEFGDLGANTGWLTFSLANQLSYL